jgi:hypothetical protein
VSGVTVMEDRMGGMVACTRSSDVSGISGVEAGVTSSSNSVTASFEEFSGYVKQAYLFFSRRGAQTFSKECHV